ncbi:hypothetical protein ACROYT_G014126 [Oculina patagonica]
MRSFCQTHSPHLYDMLLSAITRDDGRATSKNHSSVQEQRIVALLHTMAYFSKDAVVKFSWAAVSDEFKNRAPLFFRVLMAGAWKNEDSAAVTNAAATVLKQRDKAMSLVQYITGLTLKMGDTSKQRHLSMRNFLRRSISNLRDIMRLEEQNSTTRMLWKSFVRSMHLVCSMTCYK